MGKKTLNKKRKGKKTCKRRRVRKNPDGSWNKKDLAHNITCSRLRMGKDNPWMNDVMKKSKKINAYDKFLKHLIKKNVGVGVGVGNVGKRKRTRRKRTRL